MSFNITTVNNTKPNVAGAIFTEKYESKSASFTAEASRHYSLSTSGGAVTATLPARSSLDLGAVVRFKLYDATNTLTLTPTGADTVDGETSYLMSNTKQSVTLINGAADWEIV
jgi:hypothetical protein